MSSLPSVSSAAFLSKPLTLLHDIKEMLFIWTTAAFSCTALLEHPSNVVFIYCESAKVGLSQNKPGMLLFFFLAGLCKSIKHPMCSRNQQIANVFFSKPYLSANGRLVPVNMLYLHHLCLNLKASLRKCTSTSVI